MSIIILFRGKSATGKTTLSNELGRRLQLPVLHKDDLYDSIASRVTEHGSRNQICFDFLYRFLETIIYTKASIVLDFGFNHIRDALNLKDWIESRGGTLHAFQCVCSDDSVWSDRLTKRSMQPLPNQLITNLAQLKQHYQDANAEQLLDGEIILDTVQDTESLTNQALSLVMAHSMQNK
ncbi:AAA family ATPase [Paenibacillus sp. PR3]|uniref:AAA family ATPase n=1 Tax=Paenibacillus terricola TaxID=2763503 RepID=A0ABR8MWQ9_9BACL|nr:AAA family ATPase [Paenibacillus terricola]MBD3920411.1 AAA family ATPase [Paenibacillus terricola]